MPILAKIGKGLHGCVQFCSFYQKTAVLKGGLKAEKLP